MRSSPQHDVCSLGYVAGFTNPEVCNRADLFDVYVNLPDSTITVSTTAKGLLNIHSSVMLWGEHFESSNKPVFEMVLLTLFGSAATEAMAMGKVHKDIGQLIVQSAEDAERTDAQVIKVRMCWGFQTGNNSQSCHFCGDGRPCHRCCF